MPEKHSHTGYRTGTHAIALLIGLRQLYRNNLENNRQMSMGMRGEVFLRAGK